MMNTAKATAPAACMRGVAMTAVLCLGGLVTGLAQAEETGARIAESRNVSLRMQSYNTREKADQVIERLERANFNTINAMVYWYRANYKSEEFSRASWIEENPDFDPVQYLKDHAQERGWQFHAWFVNAQIASEDREEFDDLLLVDADGNKHDRRLDWSIQEVRERETRMMLEFAEMYPDVNMIQFDYVRFPREIPDGDYSYSDRAREAYKEETGIDPWDLVHNQHEFDDDELEQLKDEWYEWRVAQITSVIEDVYDGAKAINPEMMVGAAVMGREDWAVGAKQPWHRWVERGLLDLVKPMYYINNPDRYEGYISFWKDWAGDNWDRFHLPLGVPQVAGTETPIRTIEETRWGTWDDMLACLELARASGAPGVFMFRYADLTDEMIEKLGQGPFSEPAVPAVWAPTE